jgi:hypothetical protein
MLETDTEIQPEDDITLNREWVHANAERLINWEYFRRCMTLDYDEIPSQKLCDMIGMPKNYVFKVIKRAKRACIQKHLNP